MLIIVTAASVAGWLALWAVFAVRTSATAKAAARQGPPQQVGTEPPAVVSVLSGHLLTRAYPATLLDLAARGWFRLETRAGGPAMCVLGSNRSGDLLTAYERQAYAHVLNRAGSSPDVPAAALGDGFAGTAGPGGGTVTDGTAKSGKDAFMEAFTKAVAEDARTRGLTHPRLTNASGCLLWVAALVPAILSALALNSHHNHAYWIPIAGFIALGAIASFGTMSEKPTPAGQAALRSWQARCGGPGPAPGLSPGWPPREVAYAAALGKAKAAVKLFSGTPGDPRGKTTWSSYGGYWRQITIGDPSPRGPLQVGGVLVSIVALILLALLPATIATVILAHGEIRAAALGAMAIDAVIVLRLLTKDLGTPTFAEFDGRVIEAWIEEESGENTSYTYLCLAIDDGVSDRAWVFRVSGEQYRRFVPGTLVHAQVNPRRNKPLDIRLLGNGVVR